MSDYELGKESMVECDGGERSRRSGGEIFQIGQDYLWADASGRRHPAEGGDGYGQVFAAYRDFLLAARAGGKRPVFVSDDGIVDAITGELIPTRPPRGRA